VAVPAAVATVEAKAALMMSTNVLHLKSVQVAIDKSNEIIENAALRAVQRRGEKVKKNAYRGIWLDKNKKRWRTKLHADGKQHYGGYHSHAIGAALAYDALLRIHMDSVELQLRHTGGNKGGGKKTQAVGSCRREGGSLGRV
jgi:hypothetical protein